MQLTRASRPEGGLGPDCCRLIQILGKDFQSFCPCWGAFFFFFIGPEPALWAVSETAPAFPDMPTLFDWAYNRGSKRRGRDGPMGHSRELCISKLQRKFSIKL